MTGLKKSLMVLVLIGTMVLMGCAKTKVDDGQTADSTRTYARFSGSFTATVEELLPDY